MQAYKTRFYTKLTCILPRKIEHTKKRGYKAHLGFDLEAYHEKRVVFEENS